MPLSMDTDEVTLFFMADKDYGLYSTSEDKVNIFQITSDSTW
jgi:hypothetical protein